MKDKKIAYIKAISNINVKSIMKDSERGNLYRGVVSDKRLDGYVEEIKKRIAEADQLLE